MHLDNAKILLFLTEVGLFFCVCCMPETELPPPPPPLYEVDLFDLPTPPQRASTYYDIRTEVQEVFLEVFQQSRWRMYAFGTFVTYRCVFSVIHEDFMQLPKRIRFGELDPYITENITSRSTEGGVELLCVDNPVFSFPVKTRRTTSFNRANDGATEGVILNAGGELEQYHYVCPIGLRDSDKFIKVPHVCLGNRRMVSGKALISYSGLLLGLYTYAQDEFLYFIKTYV